MASAVPKKKHPFGDASSSQIILGFLVVIVVVFVVLISRLRPLHHKMKSVGDRHSMVEVAA